MGRLEKALLVGYSTGERPFHMSEQLTFQKAFRHSPAIDTYKGFILLIALEMDGPGYQLLSCTTFACDEDCAAVVGNLLNERENFQHLTAFT